MDLATTTFLYGGGEGSGCHGENCGRPSLASREQSDYAKSLLDEHDKIKEDPRRAHTGFRSEIHQKAVLTWQRQKLQSLMDKITDASSNSDVRAAIRKANERLEKADEFEAKEEFNWATIKQEEALMYLHEAIDTIQRYSSTVRVPVGA